MSDLYNSDGSLNSREAVERLAYWLDHLSDPGALNVAKTLVRAIGFRLSGQEHITPGA